MGGKFSLILIRFRSFSDDIEVLYRELKMLVLDYLGFSPTATTNSYYVGTAEILCSTATSENYSKDSEDSTVTTSSRAWSRPKSNISTNFVRRNISFQSSEVSSLELASLKRRRALAKAALVGIPYISKEHLSNNGCVHVNFSLVGVTKEHLPTAEFVNNVSIS